MSQPICEWCGSRAVVSWFKVTIPMQCCSYYICQQCVDAGEERGGGTAVCWDCGAVASIRVMDEVVTWWRPRWKIRRTRVVHWRCAGGCDSPEPPGDGELGST